MSRYKQSDWNTAWQIVITVRSQEKYAHQSKPGWAQQFILVISAAGNAEIGRFVIGGLPWQKVGEILSRATKKLDMVVCACRPSHKGSINRGIMIQVNPGINTRPCLENN
jgi:hypothetical protein